MVAAFTVLIFILVASKLIEAIPLASLVGMMIVVVVSTFDWMSIRLVLVSLVPQTLRQYGDFDLRYKIKRTDAFVIVLVTVVTLVQDLFVAVAAGVLFTAVGFDSKA